MHANVEKLFEWTVSGKLLCDKLAYILSVGQIVGRKDKPTTLDFTEELNKSDMAQIQDVRNSEL